MFQYGVFGDFLWLDGVFGIKVPGAGEGCPLPPAAGGPKDTGPPCGTGEGCPLPPVPIAWSQTSVEMPALPLGGGARGGFGCAMAAESKNDAPENDVQSLTQAELDA